MHPKKIFNQVKLIKIIETPRFGIKIKLSFLEDRKTFMTNFKMVIIRLRGCLFIVIHDYVAHCVTYLISHKFIQPDSD